MKFPPFMPHNIGGDDNSTFGRYGHVVKPDGSYIVPKNFIDEFSIHMHKNRQ